MASPSVSIRPPTPNAHPGQPRGRPNLGSHRCWLLIRAGASRDEGAQYAVMHGVVVSPPVLAWHACVGLLTKYPSPMDTAARYTTGGRSLAAEPRDEPSIPTRDTPWDEAVAAMQWHWQQSLVSCSLRLQQHLTWPSDTGSQQDRPPTSDTRPPSRQQAGSVSCDETRVLRPIAPPTSGAYTEYGHTLCTISTVRRVDCKKSTAARRPRARGQIKG